jgi:hypothetical protein
VDGAFLESPSVMEKSSKNPRIQSKSMITPLKSGGIAADV